MVASVLALAPAPLPVPTLAPPLALHLRLIPQLSLALEPVLAGLVEHGRPIRDVAIEAEMPGRPGVRVSWCAHGYLVRGDRGKLIGIGLVAEDVTAQTRAERARDLLARELGHRIKNVFAVIASMITLSARGNPASLSG